MPSTLQYPLADLSVDKSAAAPDIFWIGSKPRRSVRTSGASMP